MPLNIMNIAKRLHAGMQALAILPVAMLSLSCQQHQLSASGGRLAYRNYPDAVTHINAVDPAYRPYFTRQHGSNYSLADQRRAFVAATQTARTPVQSDARHARSATATRRKAVSHSRKKMVRAKKRKSSSRKAVARRRR